MRGDSVLLMSIEMALRYRGKRCVWTRVNREHTVTLVGVDDGRAFAVALDDAIGLTNDQVALLVNWQAAGASVGSASNIREALMIVSGEHAG